MATSKFDIVVLSSSPPDYAKSRTSARAGATPGVARSSLSPSPPSNPRRVGMPPISPLQLSPRTDHQFKSHGTLKSGSRAATIPEGARRGFATARSLVVDTDDEELPEFDWDARVSPEAACDSRKAPTKAKKPSAKAGASDNAEAPKPAPKPASKPRGRKPKVSKDDEPAKPAKPRKKATARTTSSHFPTPAGTESVDFDDNSQTRTKPTKLRKPRTKKTAENEEVQTTAKKTRLAKPKDATKAGKGPRGKAADAASAHFGEARGKAESKIAAESSIAGESIWDVPMSPSVKSSGKPTIRAKQSTLEEQPLDLDEAISRRRDWTPIKDSAVVTTLTNTMGKENESVSLVDGNGCFTNMISGFAFAHDESASHVTISKQSHMDRQTATKRRRVELVDVPANHIASRQSSPEKGKAPKKKPRTITDLVTEQYAPKSASSGEGPVTSNFFSLDRSTATTTKVPLNDTLDQPKAKASKKLPRQRSASKSASEKEDSKAKSKPKKAPAKSANAQPKLAAEKLLSPTSALLRLEQQDVLFGTSSQLVLDESPTTLRHIQQALLASENDAGIDVPPVPYTSAHPCWPRLERVKGKRHLWAAGARDEDGETLEKQAVYMPLPQPDHTQDVPLPLDAANVGDDVPSATAESPPSKLVSEPIFISSDLPTPPSTVFNDTSRKSSDEGSSHTRIYESLNDPLNDLWNESLPSNQNAPSVSVDYIDIPTSAQLPPDSPTPPRQLQPKPKRGRTPKSHSVIPQPKSSMPTISPSTPPRKTDDRFAFIEEILDSEDDAALSPTPPRRKKRQDLPPLELTVAPPSPTNAALTPIFLVPETHLQFAAIKPTLFPKITSLIRALPPTTDPAKPSWHEKILMYDAIVLEDFTAFLNAYPEIRTYRRATQKQIRDWNREAKRRGEEVLQAEKESGMVIAVEKEVEVWMVRGWCEEFSVCCVAREGRGRGGVRKGLY